MSTPVPQELLDYLITMISPPNQDAMFWDGLEGKDIGNIPDGSLAGLILRGTPTEEQSAELLRILKPGAHILLIAPDESPTGFQGACQVEDAGFEIRDAILWVREPGRIHYVPKASRTEREGGCAHLTGRTGAQAVDRQEDTAGMDSPRAGAGRTADTVKNFHPTVKPVAIMERLLEDVPKDMGPVLDPFMGSGTTGVAACKTGHDFVGVEREPEYLQIADARVRHQNAQRPWQSATIKSDHKDGDKKEFVKSDIEDLFG